MKQAKASFLSLLTLFLLLFLSISTFSQGYFGKNKVQYEDLEFKVYETPHFDIYHYLDDEEELNMLAQLSERWYQRHQAILRDTFPGKNPLIFYNNQADFKQTTVLQQRISVGLGGVTEGLRTRVIMPITVSNKETSHVLGHEMIHVFQYKMAKNTPGMNIRNLNNMPMWMIEGLPEYMTLGPNDTHTAIWMRDRVANDDIPSIEDVSKNPREYFPYRYGHAIWSFLTGMWGDAIVKPLEIITVRQGMTQAFDSLFGYKPDTVSDMWARSMKEFYLPYTDDTIGVVGNRVIQDPDESELIHSPVISPDGKYITYISDRNVISIDVYLANLETGEVISRLTRAVQKTYIDDYSYLESAGSFSPDSKKYVLTTFIDGRNQLLVIDVDDVREERTINMPGVEVFKNPAWSPDGNKIVVAGLSQGQSDLYMYNLENNEVIRLTNDDYSDLQPDWSPDGSKIVFTSDRVPETELELYDYGHYQICTYDVNTGEVEKLGLFTGANNISPQYSSDGNSIFFLSNSDGFRNLYEYDIENDQIYKRTKYFTGIIGVTEYSPVLSVNGEDDRIAYTLYKDGTYQLYHAPADEFPRFEVDASEVDLTPSVLPPQERSGVNIVAQNLEQNPMVETERFDKEPYDPRFQLEFVGSSGVGVGVSSYGTALAGGVSLLFSDILKKHQLYTTLRVQGQIEDIGGQVSYINRDSRLNWGASYSHIPFRTSGAAIDTVDTEQGELINLAQLVRRTFQDQLTLFTEFPFSVNLRLEGGISMSRYGVKVDSIANLYTQQGIPVGREEVDNIEDREPNYIGNVYAALVGDNSRMGMTSPLMGNRYRFQVQRYYTDLNLWSFLADYRKYWFANPISFAVRGMFYGRVGDDEDKLNPLFIGNNYFVRGYTVQSFRENQCPNCLEINRLIGSKIAVANAEIRLPFTGPPRLALIKSGFLFSDLVLFADGGLAWDDPENLQLSTEVGKEDDRIPVFSTGVALRLNLFGYFVLEPYLAFPFQRENKSTVFNLYISAGGW